MSCLDMLRQIVNDADGGDEGGVAEGEGEGTSNANPEVPCGNNC